MTMSDSQPHEEREQMPATPLPSADVLCPHCQKRLDRFVTQESKEDAAFYRRLGLVGCGHCHVLIHIVELPMRLGGHP